MGKGTAMKSKPPILAAGAVLLAAVIPVFAHHSFAAEFDQNKSVTLVGVVTKVEWMNPHTHFYVDVKTENGSVVNWDLETTSPNALSRQGWTRNSLKVGDTITVHALRAKDGSNIASARQVTLADGRKVFAGSADDAAPGSEK